VEKFVNVARETLAAISSWESRLEKRQHDLSGNPVEGCLSEVAPKSWEQYQKSNRLVVASMCLAENDCDACYKYLQRMG